MKPKIKRSWLVLGVAAVLGVGAGFTAMRYLNQKVAAIEARDKNKVMRKVVVAREDMQKGGVITFQNMAVREVPAEWAHSGAITPDQFDRVENATLAYPAVKGEPLIWSQLEGQKMPSFSARLSAGRRAVTVPVDEISSLSGMVEPGDSIDIVVTTRKNDRNITFALLQSVKVLATGTRVTQQGETEGKSRTYSTITLDTTPDDARRVIAAREVGKITALLRAPGDTRPISREKSDALALLGLADHSVSVSSSVPVIYGGKGSALEDVPRLFAPGAVPAGPPKTPGFAPNIHSNALAARAQPAGYPVAGLR